MQQQRQLKQHGKKDQLMSTKAIEKNTTLEPVVSPLSIQELGKVLAKHYGLTEGKYDVVIEFAIGMGAIGPTPETRVPGAMVGVRKIGLIPTETVTPLTIDLSETDI